MAKSNTDFLDTSGLSCLFPRGVTGFFKVGDEIPAPLDAKIFRGHCFAAARALHGQVKDQETPATANYVAFSLEGRCEATIILVNQFFPLVGFRAPGTVEFVDGGEWAEIFHDFGVYQVFSKTELEENVTEAMCVQLSEVELREMKYWKKMLHPLHVGQVLFNSWD